MRHYSVLLQQLLVLMLGWLLHATHCCLRVDLAFHNDSEHARELLAELGDCSIIACSPEVLGLLCIILGLFRESQGASLRLCAERIHIVVRGHRKAISCSSGLLAPLLLHRLASSPPAQHSRTRDT